jgi:hypothetical protein
VRYQKARALGKERFEQAVREDQDLLREFKMALLSVEGGLRIVPLAKANRKINAWDVIAMSPYLWEWLRPLLVELSRLRKGALTGAAVGVAPVRQQAP